MVSKVAVESSGTGLDRLPTAASVDFSFFFVELSVIDVDALLTCTSLLESDSPLQPTHPNIEIITIEANNTFFTFFSSNKFKFYSHLWQVAIVASYIE